MVKETKGHRIRAMGIAIVIAVVAAYLASLHFGLLGALVVGLGVILVSYGIDYCERRKMTASSSEVSPAMQQEDLGSYVVDTGRVNVSIPANQIGSGLSVWAQRRWSRRPDVIQWDPPVAEGGKGGHGAPTGGDGGAGGPGSVGGGGGGGGGPESGGGGGQGGGGWRVKFGPNGEFLGLEPAPGGTGGDGGGPSGGKGGGT